LPFAHALLPRLDREAALADVASLEDRSVLGRCFLETQLYDRPEWTKYLIQERNNLTSQGQHGWDEALLRRLHLFIVVVRDARDWFEQVARQSTHRELDDVFATIVQGSRNAVVQVFSTYASQDAAAAIRLAEEVGLDMVSEHPEIVIESCQEESFLALALERLSSDGLKLWASILTTAALRYGNVARRLDGTPAPVASDSVPISWKQMMLLSLAWVESDSLYAAILLHILNNNDTSWASNLVKQSNKYVARMYWIYKTRGAAIVLALSILILVAYFKVNLLLSFAVFAFIIGLASVYTTTARRITRSAYRFIFNLSSRYIDEEIANIDGQLSGRLCRLIAPDYIDLLYQVKGARNMISDTSVPSPSNLKFE